MENKMKSFPRKNRLKDVYESYVPLLSSIVVNIENELKKIVTLTSMPTYKSRIKSFSSYYRKVLRVKPQDAVDCDDFVILTDVMGIRIICPFLEDLSDVERQVTDHFKVIEIEHKGAAQNFREFGYESVHILIKVPVECIPETDLSIPSDIVCEIQIRTILQDAWAEVEHELIYKSEFSPFDMPLRRKLASMNASLSLADIIFQEIRDYQKKLQGEVETRRLSFYEQADELTRLQTNSIEKVTDLKGINRVSPYVRGTVDDMLLEAIHAHNVGDLDRAISIYTQIINCDPVPQNIVLSVIYKHRGMAYFSKNNYDKALVDFDQSTKYDEKNFRSYYYKGIVYSVMNEDLDAVKCYTRSLELNRFQSHAYFRRALSYFKLGEDEKSLSDVSIAEQLGLSSDDCKSLHSKLVNKFDMNI